MVFKESEYLQPDYTQAGPQPLTLIGHEFHTPETCMKNEQHKQSLKTHKTYV